MLGIKAGSVNLPLRKIVFGEKELVFIRLSAFVLDPVRECNRGPDVTSISKIQLVV